MSVVTLNVIFAIYASRVSVCVSAADDVVCQRMPYSSRDCCVECALYSKQSEIDDDGGTCGIRLMSQFEKLKNVFDQNVDCYVFPETTADI